MVTLSSKVRIPKWTFCGTTVMPSFRAVSPSMSDVLSVTILTVTGFIIESV